MVRDDIVAGLRNAVERGSSIEQAKKSFINAGYNSKEVEQAANSLSGGAIMPEQPGPKIKPAPQQKAEPAPKPGQLAPKTPEKKKGKKWVIILLIILAILIILGVLIFVFQDQVIELVEDIFNL